MVERLLEKGYEVAAFDRNSNAVTEARRRGAQTAASLAGVVSALPLPRLIWVMVPHQAVDAVLGELTPLLAEGDTVVDGGNSPYKESIRRSAKLAGKGIDFLDAGVSGGPSGARNGACIMVGGKHDVFLRFERLFADLSVEQGNGYVGRAGAGHFVKMVHNGIEYGMMQALAEGFAVLKAAPFSLDLRKVADLYDHASVIESRLVGWLKTAYGQYGAELRDISGAVEQSGEGAWTVDAGRELGVPTPVIEDALQFRFRSREAPSYTGQVLSALRSQFGGHDVRVK
jgi:6-phosphogluconate dehydrogenase